MASTDLTGERLAARLAERCWVTGEFKLRSGARATTYFDKFRFTSDPVLLRAVARALVPLIPPGTEILAGLELGGVPIAAALCVVDRTDGNTPLLDEVGISLHALFTSADVPEPH